MITDGYKFLPSFLRILRTLKLSEVLELAKKEEQLETLVKKACEVAGEEYFPAYSIVIGEIIQDCGKKYQVEAKKKKEQLDKLKSKEDVFFDGLQNELKICEKFLGLRFLWKFTNNLKNMDDINDLVAKTDFKDPDQIGECGKSRLFAIVKSCCDAGGELEKVRVRVLTKELKDYSQGIQQTVLGALTKPETNLERFKTNIILEINKIKEIKGLDKLNDVINLNIVVIDKIKTIYSIDDIIKFLGHGTNLRDFIKTDAPKYLIESVSDVAEGKKPSHRDIFCGQLSSAYKNMAGYYAKIPVDSPDEFLDLLKTSISGNKLLTQSGFIDDLLLYIKKNVEFPDIRKKFSDVLYVEALVNELRPEVKFVDLTIDDNTVLEFYIKKVKQLIENISESEKDPQLISKAFLIKSKDVFNNVSFHKELNKKIYKSSPKYVENLIKNDEFIKKEIKFYCDVAAEIICSEEFHEIRREYSQQVLQYANAINNILVTLKAKHSDIGFNDFILILVNEFKKNNNLFANSEDIKFSYKEKRPAYYKMLRDWHFKLAIADILVGSYDELDPIIGDQACEMRCPFILDISAHVHDRAVAFLKDNNKDPDYLKGLALKVAKAGRQIANDRQMKYKLLVATLTAIDADFVEFCRLCRKSLAQLDGPSTTEFLGHPVTFDAVPYTIAEEEKTIDLKVDVYNSAYQNKTIDFTDDDPMTREVFDAGEYLRICKTGTRNRDALLDEFGIDIDHHSNWEFYDIAHRQKRWFVNNLNDGTSHFEKQMLAHCSTAYMKYTARCLTKETGMGIYKSIGKLFEHCHSTINNSGFFINMLPVYEAFRVILAQAALKGYPIIVKLTRLMVKEGRFVYQKTFMLGYEYDKKRGTFVHSPDLDPERPGIAVVAASVYNPELPLAVDKVKGAAFANEADPDEFIKQFISCDIGHLLMWFACNHPIFPNGAKIPMVRSIKDQKPTIEWVTPKTHPDDVKGDGGRHYHRQHLYRDILDAPKPRLENDRYTFSLQQAPCPLLQNGEDHQQLDWEYDYYVQLTEAFGLKLEDLKYALMTGERDKEIVTKDGIRLDTEWERNLQTLPFVPTHMYVTSMKTERSHLDQLTIAKSTGQNMFKTGLKTKIEAYDPPPKILLLDDDQRQNEGEEYKDQDDYKEQEKGLNDD